jgi:hypothetical protein
MPWSLGKTFPPLSGWFEYIHLNRRKNFEDSITSYHRRQVFKPCRSGKEMHDVSISTDDERIFSMTSYLVFAFKLMFHETETPQFPGEFKGREDRVLRGQRDEGRTRKSAVSVDSGSGVSQRVLLSWRHTLVATTSEKRVRIGLFILELFSTLPVINQLKITTELNYVFRFSSYRAVNTFLI